MIGIAQARGRNTGAPVNPQLHPNLQISIAYTVPS